MMSFGDHIIKHNAKSRLIKNNLKIDLKSSENIILCLMEGGTHLSIYGHNIGHQNV